MHAILKGKLLEKILRLSLIVYKKLKGQKKSESNKKHSKRNFDMNLSLITDNLYT